MRASDIPSKMPVVWASNAGADTHAVPVSSQIGITNGAASFTDGFPPLNFLPVASGGVAPFGTDFNGIFQAITQWNQWQQLGGPVPFDNAFAAAIAGLGTPGYPRGASIAGTLGTGNVVPGCIWFNLSDGNTNNPDVGGSGWSQMFMLNGTTTINVSGNTDVTLTPAQYGYRHIQCNGTLTGNINLNFPSLGGPWIVFNNTNANFTITARTAVGGFAIPQGYEQFIYTDGVKIIPASIAVSPSGNALIASGLISVGLAQLEGGQLTNFFTMGTGAATGTWYNALSLAGFTGDAFDVVVRTTWNTTTSIARYSLLCSDGSFVLTLINGGGLVALQLSGTNLQAQQTAQPVGDLHVTWDRMPII